MKPDNPYFARSFVNRVWGVYFGTGIVDPVDGFSVTNPPSNARLLDALAVDFVVHGYDIRRLERTVLNSRAYQRSSQPVAGNLDHQKNFARSVPRPLMAEVLVDALDAALGVPGEFGPDVPKGGRAIEIATNRVTAPDLARAFRILGRPERASVCDCERPKAPALPQTLFLMTDGALLAKLKAGRARTLGGVGTRCDAEAIEELFLAALSRPPVPGTKPARRLDHLRSSLDRASGLADVLWSYNQYARICTEPLNLPNDVERAADMYRPRTDCEGFHRRDFLRVGAAGLLGISSATTPSRRRPWAPRVSGGAGGRLE